MALIDVEGLSYHYGAHRVLAGITLHISEGERVAILGGNGSGKSTLARLLAGWLPDAAEGPGRVRYAGKPLAHYTLAQRVVLVQMTGQIPSQHLSGRAFCVSDEVAFGPENLGLPQAEIQARVDQALAATGLQALAERDPFTLSGGEQQRLVIAATLALRPAVLILDEPFSNLDPASRDDLAHVIRSLPRQVTVVLFETNPDRALSVAERFIGMSQGHIVCSGSARDVLLDDRIVADLGWPAVTRAVRDSDLPAPIKQARPLTLAEVEAGLRE